MGNIQLAFWDIEPRLNPDFRDSLKIFYRRIPQVAQDSQPLLWDADVDALLRAAADRPGLRWLCVMAVGTVFPDQGRIVELVQAAIAERSRESFLAMGQLINKSGRYCGIHEQTFIVDLDTYRRLGLPKFGAYGAGPQRLREYEAGPSIHDGYTPRFVKPLPGEKIYETWMCGWNFVNVSLASGLAVHNLPDELRHEKIYAYPDDDLARLNRNLARLYEFEDMENPTQRRLFAHLWSKRLGRENLGPVFLFNTEELLQRPEWIAQNRRPLDIYLGPCSGFLELANLYAHGFHPGTKIIYYDINERSIAYKKRILLEFDGQLKNLGSFFRALQRADDQPIHLGAPAHEIEKLLSVFGSAENFRGAWRKLQQLEKEFVPTNLLSHPEPLLKRCSPDARTLFAISDIFTGQNELTYGYSGIRSHFRKLLQACRGHVDLILTGRDPDGLPFIDYASNLPM